MRELVLDNWNLNDFNVQNICSNWRDLRKVMVGCANDEALAHIARHCTKLEELEITQYGHSNYDRCTISGIVTVLKNCPRIHTLTMPFLRGSDTGVAHIRQICVQSSSIVNLTIGLHFWNRSIVPSIPWIKKMKLMDDAAIEASLGRLNVIVRDGFV